LELQLGNEGQGIGGIGSRFAFTAIVLDHRRTRGADEEQHMVRAVKDRRPEIA
jgi:hypothetical protein